jgi:hypothetical protein
MSDTNVFIHGTGTANDPQTFEFHTAAESVMAPRLFRFEAACVLLLIVCAGYVAFRVSQRKK